MPEFAKAARYAHYRCRLGASMASLSRHAVVCALKGVPARPPIIIDDNHLVDC